MPWKTRQVTRYTSGAPQLVTERYWTADPQVKVSSLDPKVEANAALAERRAVAAKPVTGAQRLLRARAEAKARSAKAAADAKAKAEAKTKMWQGLRASAAAARATLAPTTMTSGPAAGPNAARSPTHTTLPGRKPVQTSPSTDMLDPRHEAQLELQQRRAHDIGVALGKTAKQGGRELNLTQATTTLKNTPKAGKILEGLLVEARKNQVASKGQDVNTDFLDKVTTAYDKYTGYVHSQIEQRSKHLNRWMYKDKKGGWHYKNPAAQENARRYMESSGYNTLIKEAKRLWGDGFDNRTGSYSTAWGAYKELADGQKYYLRDAAKAAFFSEPGLTGRDEWQREQDWEKNEKWLYIASLDDIKPTETSYIYHYDFNGGGMVRGRRRTVEEEYEFRSSQYRNEMLRRFKEQANSMLLAQNPLLYDPRAEMQIERYSRSGEKSADEALANSIKVLGLKGDLNEVSQDPKMMKAVIDDALATWDSQNLHLFTKRVPSRVWGGGPDEWRITNEKDRKAYEEAKNKYTELLYKRFGAEKPAWWQEALGLPIVKPATQTLGAIGSLPGTAIRLAVAWHPLSGGAYGGSRVDMGLDWDALPKDIQTQARAAGDASTSGGGFLEMLGRTSELGHAFNEAKASAFVEHWINAVPAGQKWMQEYAAGVDATTKQQNANFMRDFYGEGKNIWDKMDAVSAFGAEPTTAPIVNFLSQFALDPTVKLPFNFLTYVSRYKHAAEAASQVSKLKAVPKFLTEFQKVEAPMLRAKELGAPYLARARAGEDPQKLMDEILQNLADIGEEQGADAVRKKMREYGLEKRQLSGELALTSVQEEIAKYWEQAGINYEDMLTKMSSAEDDIARKAAEKAAREAKSPHLHVEDARTAAKAVKEKTAVAEAEAGRKAAQARRQRIVDRLATRIATPAPNRLVDEVAAPLAAEVPVAAAVHEGTAVPRATRAAARAGSHLETPVEAVVNDIVHAETSLRQLVTEKNPYTGQARLEHRVRKPTSSQGAADWMAAATGYRSVVIDHNAHFSPGPYYDALRDTAKYKAVIADLDEPLLNDLRRTPTTAAKKIEQGERKAKAQRQLFEWSRRSTAIHLRNEGRLDLPTLKNGEIPWEVKTDGEAYVAEGGRASHEQHIVTRHELAEALSGATDPAEEMMVYAEREATDILAKQLLSKRAALSAGHIGFEDYVEFLEKLTRTGIFRRTSELTIDMRAGEGSLVELSEQDILRAIRNPDWLPLGEGMVEDLMDYDTLGHYYETFSVLPGMNDGPGYQTLLMKNILTPSWRAGLTRRDFANILRRNMFGFRQPSPMGFRTAGAHLHALFSHIMLDDAKAFDHVANARIQLDTGVIDGAAYNRAIDEAYAMSNGGMKQLRDFGQTVRVLMVNNQDSPFLHMWKVMETRAGVYWADDFIDAEGGFLKAMGGEEGNRLHPNMALAMIPYAPLARGLPVTHGFVGKLRDLAVTQNPLFRLSIPSWTDDVVTANIQMIFHAKGGAQDGVMKATQIIHYLMSRYGDTITRKHLTDIRKDFSIQLAYNLRDVNKAGREQFAAFRDAYIEARYAVERADPLLSDDVIRTQAGKDFDELFTKPLPFEKAQRRPFPPEVRELYDELYWSGRISHDNPGLHTMAFLERMGDPNYQRGQSYLDYVDSYYQHMIKAGDEIDAHEVIAEVLKTDIRQVNGEAFEVLTHMGESAGPLKGRWYGRLRRFLYSNGFLQPMENLIAEGKQREHATQQYAQEELDRLGEANEALLDIHEKEISASEGRSMFVNSPVEHLVDRALEVTDKMAVNDRVARELSQGSTVLDEAANDVRAAETAVRDAEREHLTYLESLTAAERRKAPRHSQAFKDAQDALADAEERVQVMGVHQQAARNAAAELKKETEVLRSMRGRATKGEVRLQKQYVADLKVYADKTLDAAAAAEVLVRDRIPRPIKEVMDEHMDAIRAIGRRTEATKEAPLFGSKGITTYIEKLPAGERPWVIVEMRQQYLRGRLSILMNNIVERTRDMESIPDHVDEAMVRIVDMVNKAPGGELMLAEWAWVYRNDLRRSRLMDRFRHLDFFEFSDAEETAARHMPNEKGEPGYYWQSDRTVNALSNRLREVYGQLDRSVQRVEVRGQPRDIPLTKGKLAALRKEAATLERQLEEARAAVEAAPVVDEHLLSNLRKIYTDLPEEDLVKMATRKEGAISDIPPKISKLESELSLLETGLRGEKVLLGNKKFPRWLTRDQKAAARRRLPQVQAELKNLRAQRQMELESGRLKPGRDQMHNARRAHEVLTEAERLRAKNVNEFADAVAQDEDWRLAEAATDKRNAELRAAGQTPEQRRLAAAAAEPAARLPAASELTRQASASASFGPGTGWKGEGGMTSELGIGPVEWLHHVKTIDAEWRQMLETIPSIKKKSGLQQQGLYEKFALKRWFEMHPPEAAAAAPVSFPPAKGLDTTAERGTSAAQAAEQAKVAEMVPPHRISSFIEPDRDDLVRGLNPAVDDYLNSLLSSIEATGLRRPIVIKEFSPGGPITVVDGNHRLVVAMEAGVEEVPVVVLREDGSFGPPSELFRPGEAGPAVGPPPAPPGAITRRQQFVDAIAQVQAGEVPMDPDTGQPLMSLSKEHALKSLRERMNALGPAGDSVVVPRSTDFTAHPRGEMYSIFDGPFEHPDFHQSNSPSPFYQIDYGGLYRGPMSKIHVAGGFTNGQEILRIVDAIARDMKVTYKWVKSATDLLPPGLNGIGGGDFGNGGIQQGKFITAYPDPQIAKEFTRRLDEALTQAGIVGGHVAPSERRYAPDSPITHRFVPNAASGGERFAADGDYAANPDFIGFRPGSPGAVAADPVAAAEAAAIKAEALASAESAGPSISPPPGRFPPTPPTAGDLNHPRIHVSQRGLEILGQMTEDQFIAREMAQAQRARRLAKTPQARKVASARITELDKVMKVIAWSKAGRPGTFLTQETRRSFNTRIKNVVGERAKAVFAHSSISPFVFEAGGARTERGRAEYKLWLTSSVDMEIRTKVRKVGAVSDTYKNKGAAIEALMDKPVIEASLRRYGLNENQLAGMTYTELLTGISQFERSLRSGEFSAWVDEFVGDIDKRLKAETGDDTYTMERWLDDRLQVRDTDYFDVNLFDEVEPEATAAINAERPGEIRSTKTDLKRMPGDIPPEEVHALAELVESDVRAVVGRNKALAKRGIDPHAYAEAWKVLRKPLQRERYGLDILRRAKEQAAKALYATGHAVEDADWDTAFREEQDRQFLAIRQKDGDSEALKLLNKLANEMQGASARQIIEEFERRYSMDFDIKNHQPPTVTQFQKRTLEEAAKTHLNVTDLNDNGQLVVGLSSHGQAPPFNNRAAMRDWLVKYGFWSPRTADVIDKGKASWSIQQEEQYFMQSFGRVPEWANVSLIEEGGRLREAVLFDEVARSRLYREWGLFNRNMKARFATGDMTQEERARFLVEGSADLDVKPKRDIPMERKYIKERYGKLAFDENDHLIAFPELMNEDELRRFIVQRGVDNVPDRVFQSVQEMNVFKELAGHHIGRYFDEFPLKGKTAGWPDMFVASSAIVHDMMLDPIWLLRTRDQLGWFIRTQAAIRRALVFTQLGFMLTNFVDTGIKLPLADFNLRSFATGSMSDVAAGLTVKKMGWDPGGQLLHSMEDPGTARIQKVLDGRAPRYYKWGGKVVQETPQEKRMGDVVQFAMGVSELPLQGAAKAENFAKLRMAQKYYDGVLARYIADGHAPDVADALARKYLHDEIGRLWPTSGNGPIETLFNQLSPFASYQFKNRMVYIGELAEHPVLFNYFDHIGDAIEKHNREEWEKKHPGERLPDNLARLIEIPWAPGIFIDLGQMSDGQRAFKTLTDWGEGKQTVQSLASQFVRLAGASDINFVEGWANALEWGWTKQWVQERGPNGQPVGRWYQVDRPWQAPWGGDANWLNSFWPVELGTQLDKTIKGNWNAQELTKLMFQATFFGGLKEYDRGAGLNGFYWALKDKDPDAADKWLNESPQGSDLRTWWTDKIPRSFDAYTPQSIKDILYPRKGDPNPWLHNQTKAYQDQIKANLDEISRRRMMWDNVIWKQTPGTPGWDQAVMGKQIDRWQFLQAHPEMYDFYAGSMNANEWAKQLDDWQVDDLVQTFFNKLPPDRDKFKTEAEYQKALAAFRKDRADYLVMFPQVKERLASARNIVESVWQQTENHWFEDVLTNIGTTQIAIDAVKQAKNYSLSDQLYLMKELQGEGLNEETAVTFFDPTTDYKPLSAFDKERERGPSLREGPFGQKLLKSVTILPDMQTWRWNRADPEQRAKITRDNKYASGMAAVIKKAKASGNFAKSFVEQLKNDPWLREEYFRRNEGKRQQWATNDTYIGFMGKYHSFIAKGDFAGAGRYFDSLPAWAQDKYLNKHPKQRAFRANQQENLRYLSLMHRWSNFYKKRDYAGGAKFFDSLPQWAKDRYYSKHPTGFGRGGGSTGGSSPYSRAMGKWVKLLQDGNKAGAKAWFDSMPQEFRDRYYAGHPEAKIRDDIKRVGQLGEYFAADDANRAEYLKDNPEFAKWLKSQGNSEQTRRMLIMAAYRGIPSTETWLKRMYREKYPEIFSKEAVGEAALNKVRSTLAEHPEMTPAFEKWLSAILASYAEELKHTKNPPKPLEVIHQRQHGMTGRQRPHAGRSAAWVRLHSLS